MLSKSRFVLFALIALLALGLSVAVVACGDDDDDDDDNDDAVDDDDDDAADDDNDDATDDDNDDTTDDDTAGDDDDDDDDDDNDDDNDDNDDDATPPTELITVFVHDFMTSANMAGVTCELINNADGTSFDPPVTTTSDAAGGCAFNAPTKGLFAVKFSITAYKDAYAFNFDSANAWYFPMVSGAAISAIESLLSITVDPAKGLTAGTAYWRDATGGSYDLEPIGCADVSTDDHADVFYLDAMGLPTTGRTSTHPDNGYFLAPNTTTGARTFSADVDGNVETATVPVINADAVTFTNIFYDAPGYATNPQPGGCTK
jgi:hypothetical protein